jgi:hypothetical protein
VIGPRPPLPTGVRERLGLGAVTLLLAGLIAATPLLSGETPRRLVGALLVLAGALELLHSLRRVSLDARRAASRSAGFTPGWDSWSSWRRPWRLIPHGVNGRLRWADLQASPQLRPSHQGPDDPAEVVLPMPAGR